MSDKAQEGNITTIRSLFFNENGKLCIPCGAFESFKYLKARTMERYGTYKSQPAISNQQNTITAPVMLPPQDLIPGSRTYQKEDPPDVQKLGADSWTFLHAMAAKYPDKPTDVQKQDMSEFLKLFSHVYPCHWCATDFEKYIREYSPRVESKEELSRWMCEAHNKVNVKLGKPKFDCNFWKQRWHDGWDENQ
ncbi:hypothetical protein KAFR_0F03790 [Kazachstania africana CBS 2517]|uniref:Sulfhydryl oxidase n=1 Tax=Kazachstania africana (strain ATCC 22294 / BCRC 22015 / CBS 2517 / CECT 1963 / NBRC 1671 / NRRL Y-8276) TaxID=1071382 RepID=H2AX75_KAZAF|nr:hypothetical protein KAFR_0F03790 [Kazachstania africana CBS 2517]CCF58975.1 hypothetical protein KAFR_0F03790 [Kazachstania africana CBS 2517]